MKEHTQFNKLGLVMGKTETTARKEADLYNKIEQKVTNDGYELP